MKISKLLLMGALHFIIMYFLMYSMVNLSGHVYLNLNNAYMAALMTAPMLILEILLMGSMYQNQSQLQLIFGSGAFLLILSFIFIRQQTAIDNLQFLRSMIPHHSGAILMCQQANITDPEIQTLCTEIIASQ